MKNVLKASLSTLLALIFVFSALITTQAATIWDIEPGNNTSDGAKAIGVNGQINGSLNSYDKDWYYFDLTSPGYVSLTVSTPYKASTRDYCRFYIASLTGSGETQYISGHLSFSDTQKVTEKVGLPSGRYHVKLYDDGSYSDADGENYYFTVNYIQSNVWESEKNDSSVNADLISLNTDYHGTLTSYDKDWFTFTLNSASYVTFNISIAYKASTRNYCRYKLVKIENGKEVSKIAGYLSFSDASKTSDRIALEAGIYQICIYDDGSYTDADGEEYTFRVSTNGSSTQNYILTYHANGGSGAPAAVSGRGSIRLSSGIPVRSGYTFLGWATSASASSAQYQPGGVYDLMANATLYAVWQKNSQDGDNPSEPSTTDPVQTGTNILQTLKQLFDKVLPLIRLIVKAFNSLFQNIEILVPQQ